MTDLALLPPDRREEILEAIAETIVRLRAPEKIILFGSLAAPDPRPGGDVDLIIVEKTGKDYASRARGIRGPLAHFRIPMDIVVYTPDEWARLKDRVGWLAYEANRNGRVLYEREQ